jgi:hypothetical protein
MNEILHILNGDATFNGFKETGLDGDVMVWREILSEGPVVSNISSAEFWNKRSVFITQTFNEKKEHYHDGMIVHLEKLNEPYQEFNLWFEFDLHCQVNLLGVMMLLNQQTNLSAPAIYLISPSELPGVADFSGMGELNGEQLEYLYDNVRVQLSDYDFTLAREAWEIYACKDAYKLKEWLAKTPFWGNMHNLKAAMEAHLKRLEYNQDGFSYIHQTLINIYNKGIHTKQELYTAFWQTEKIYGMGDKELDIYLQLLTSRGIIKL